MRMPTLEENYHGLWGTDQKPSGQMFGFYYPKLNDTEPLSGTGVRNNIILYVLPT